MSMLGRREPLPLPGVNSLLDLLEYTVLSRPNEDAIFDVATNTTLSFKQFYSRVTALGRILSNSVAGLNDNSVHSNGDRVIALCMEPSHHLLVSIFAVLQAKAAYLPLDVTVPTSRAIHILKDAKPLVLLTYGDPPVVEALKNEATGVVILRLKNLEEMMQSNVEIKPNYKQNLSCSQDIAAVLYTSGSTGVPKGVRLPFSAILNRLAWQWRQFPYERNEVCCFKTALTFVDSISEIFGPLLTGHKLLVIPKAMTRDVDSFLKVLSEHRVHRIALVPTLLRSILWHYSSSTLPSLYSLRLWVCSGEVLPIDLILTFFKVFTSKKVMCNFYGSTEVLGDVTYAQFNSLEDAQKKSFGSKVPIGTPADNCSVFLLDENLEEVGEKEIGELFIAGRNLAKGYVADGISNKFINRHDATKTESEVLFITGDFGRIVDGVLFYEGRKDSQIKIRGHRIDLSEIDTALQELENVDKSYVLSYQPGGINQALVAFFTTHDSDCTPSYVKKMLNKVLPTYVDPQIIQLKDLPLLVNGKVDKQNLVRFLEDRQNQDREGSSVDLTECDPKDSDLANVLLRTVVKILGPLAPDVISLTDNFYQIGGNSLNTVLALTALNDLHYQMSVADFMKATTFLDILELMKRSKLIRLNGFTDRDSDTRARFKELMAIHNSYDYIPADKSMRDFYVDIISSGFASKGDLELAISITDEEIKPNHRIVFEIIDPPMSYVVKRKRTGEIIGISVNWDFYSEQEPEGLVGRWAYIFEILSAVESKANKHLPSGPNAAFHAMVLMTTEDVSPTENVSLLIAMELENIRLAKELRFKAIVTTNTSIATQHVCEDLLGYKPIHVLQVNEWIANDGTRPFEKSPDSFKILCSVLYLDTFSF